MASESQGQLTSFFDDLRSGSKEARDRFVAAVYPDLRRIAGSLMRAERPDHTLQPSALVNEALVRLLHAETLEKAVDRRYFFAAASQAMRQILVDHARKRKAGKRGGGRAARQLDEVLDTFEANRLDVLVIDDAIDRLTAMHDRQGLVVRLRFFSGLTTAEIATVLDVSEATVHADWRIARAWLRGQFGGESG